MKGQNHSGKDWQNANESQEKSEAVVIAENESAKVENIKSKKVIPRFLQVTLMWELI